MMKEYVFFKDETGAAAIEYGLIGALIALAIIGSLFFFSEEVAATYALIATAISDILS